MIIALLILIGLFFYFLIGRTVINLLQEHTDNVDFDDWKGLAIFIFPLVLIWGGIMIGSDYLTEAVTEFFENQNKTNK